LKRKRLIVSSFTVNPSYANRLHVELNINARCQILPVPRVGFLQNTLLAFS